MKPSARAGDEFDTTSLRAAGHGYRVHRDYASHFFRWGWVAREINNELDVLEVGCGTDYPLSRVVQISASNLPRRYVGVDLNALTKPPQLRWASFHGDFNFVERHGELGSFDRAVCLEVIEHMTRPLGDGLLAGIRSCLRPGGKLYLSTPVFNGRAAANHVHEYTVDELRGAIEAAGLTVERRFGTFASHRDIVKVATPEQIATLTALREFYSTDVTACFLAPLYPDASRNNLWVIHRD